jgi:lipoyl-dependent peroxiredoxin
MEEISRTSQATWYGDLRSGQGKIVSESGVLQDEKYTFSTRFEEISNIKGTNPEELIAAANAACFAMAFSGLLSKKGYKPESIEVRAVCVVKEKSGGGHEITRMSLDVLGKVPDLDESTFDQLAREADKTCPVSNLLRPGLQIEIETALLNSVAPQR